MSNTSLGPCDWPLGDYPYCNGFISLPADGSLHGVPDIRYEGGVSGGVGIGCGVAGHVLPHELLAGADRDALFWFRWVTGHQTVFIYWVCLAAELERALALGPGAGADNQIRNATALTEGYSALLVYTGSCPRSLYEGSFRPFIHLTHRGFSGKWAKDYRKIPHLMKRLLSDGHGQEQDAAPVSRLKRSYVENHQVHMAIAQKLVPDGASLRKQFQGEFSTEAKITQVELDRFDNFFLVRRAEIPPAVLAAQLVDRHSAIAADLGINSLFPDSFCSGEVLPETLDQGDLRRYRTDLAQLVSRASETAFQILTNPPGASRPRVKSVGVSPATDHARVS